MRASLVLIAACLMAAWNPSLAQDAPVAPRGRYVKQLALVVGINYGGLDNKEIVTTLKNAEDDAKAVHHMLTESYGYDPKDAILLLGPEATKQTIEESLAKLKDEAGPWDSIVFYYSGHGEHRVDKLGNTYAVLVPFNAHAKGPADRKVLDLDSCVDFDNLVKQYLARSEAKHSLVILDCCYSGQIFGDDGPMKNIIGNRNFDSASFNAKGIQAMSAGLASKRVPDGIGGHSPFTQALLDVLESEPQKLRPDEPAITSESLYDFVRARLDKEIKAGKTRPLFGNPPIKGNNAEANFHFFPTAEARRTKIAAVAAVADGESLRFDVQSLTGLNGQWWFDETPWLVPAIRAELATDTNLAKLRVEDGEIALAMRGGPGRGGSAFLDPDIAKVHKVLRDAIRSKGLIGDSAGPSALLSRDLIDDPTKVDKKGMEAHAERIELSLKGAPAGTRPMDRHLLAVLKHRLDQRGAQEVYLTAIADYDILIREKPEAKSLKALCVSDLARFLMMKRRYTEAIEQYRAAEALIGRQATVLYLDCLCNRSESHRRLGQWPEAQGCMTEAVKLAGSHLDATHPLRAFAHEKAAWSWFERWHLSVAIKDFEQAHLVFGDSADLNDQAMVTRLRIIHGRAMAERFAGRIIDARERFERIEAEIEGVIGTRQAKENLPPALLAQLRDRQINTMERRADSHLFRGEPFEAEEILLEAIKLAPDLPQERQQGILFRIHSMRAIALALNDRPEDAEAALRDAGSQRLMVDEFRDMHLVFALAEALTQWAKKGKGDGGSALREFVRETTNSDTEIARARRDDLELTLLAAETLADDVGRAAIEKVLKRISLVRDPDTSPFARRYQDAILRELIAKRRSGEDTELIAWTVATKLGVGAPTAASLRKRPTLLVHACETSGVAILFRPKGPPLVSTFDKGLSTWRTRVKGEPGPPPWDKPMADALASIDGSITVYWSDPITEAQDDAYPFTSPTRERCQFASATSAKPPK